MTFRRIRTKAEKRARSRREGAGDVVLGWAAAKARKWALRTLLRKHDGICALCGEPVELVPGDREATIDHIVPLSAGGTDTIANMQLAHRGCNQAKGSTP